MGTIAFLSLPSRLLTVKFPVIIRVALKRFRFMLLLKNPFVRVGWQLIMFIIRLFTFLFGKLNRSLLLFGVVFMGQTVGRMIVVAVVVTRGISNGGDCHGTFLTGRVTGRLLRPSSRGLSLRVTFGWCGTFIPRRRLIVVMIVLTFLPLSIKVGTHSLVTVLLSRNRLKRSVIFRRRILAVVGLPRKPSGSKVFKPRVMLFVLLNRSVKRWGLFQSKSPRRGRFLFLVMLKSPKMELGLTVFRLSFCVLVQNRRLFIMLRGCRLVITVVSS